MRKIIILGVFLVIILIVVFYFLRFNYISYKEIDLAIQQHHFQNKIQNEEKHYDIKQYGYFKEVKYKDEPYNTYQYDIDDNGKITGDAFLKEKYAKYSNDKKHFEEKYDLK